MTARPAAPANPPVCSLGSGHWDGCQVYAVMTSHQEGRCYLAINYSGHCVKIRHVSWWGEPEAKPILSGLRAARLTRPPADIGSWPAQPVRLPSPASGCAVNLHIPVRLSTVTGGWQATVIQIHHVVLTLAIEQHL